MRQKVFIMRKNKKENKIYFYECSITGEKFKRNVKVDNTADLVSISAYYELNPEEDDRPAVVKKELGIKEISPSN